MDGAMDPLRADDSQIASRSSSWESLTLIKPAEYPSAFVLLEEIVRASQMLRVEARLRVRFTCETSSWESVHYT